MDADILRKQLRKTLVTSKRFEAVDLEEQLAKEAKGYQEEQIKEHADDDSESDQDQEEGEDSNDDSSQEEDDGEEEESPKGMSAFWSNRSNHSGESKEEPMSPLSPLSSSPYDSGNSPLSSAKSDSLHIQGTLGSQDSPGGLLDSKGSLDRFGASFSSEDDENDEKPSHKSVLDAWSKQIEKTIGNMKKQDSDWETGGSSGMQVQYIQKPLGSPSSMISESNSVELEAPGASTREDLENLGRIFLRVKLEACLWLERTLNDQTLFVGKDRVETITLYETLKDGVLLCRLANAILPGCIPTFTTDFNESTFMIPLSERENIKRFIRACKDAMSIPDSLLFQVGDLHNMQNMPKVVLSLRAVAEYARIYLGSSPTVHWPSPQDVALEFADGDDVMLMAQAEMSKFDAKTVHHMYAVENSAPPPAPKPTTSSIEHAGFEARKRSIQQNLVMNLTTTTNSSSNSSAATKTTTPPRSVTPVSFDPTPTSSLTTDDVDNVEFLPSEEYSVETWLASIGMSCYYHNFVEEGWDEMETVILMTSNDLADVGIKKKGHKRKIANAIKKLSRSAGGDDNGDGRMNRRFSLERREIFNKDLSWSKYRSKHNVTLDLDDSKAIWGMLNDLKTKVRENRLLESLSLDAKRSVDHLMGITEDLVRSLIPYDAPIILDIGWNTIKCGYVFSTKPILFPTVVGKYDMSNSSSKRKGKGVLVAGKQVLEQCHLNLNSSSHDGSFVVRRALHRGIDSIKDPVMIEWDDIDRLLEHIYKDLLHTFSDRHPLLLIEPLRRWGLQETTRLVTLLVEKYNVPALYITPGAPMVAYQSSVKNCVVLDLGESRTSSSVIYNNRLIKGSVVHSPIGGLQLTELMMQHLTQDGYQFKSIFEAKNPGKFSSLRHFMEQEVADEVKRKVCIASNSYEEKSVSVDNMSPHIGEYLPRVTRGIPYINIKEPRVTVPEALFKPDIIRRDQFYNGGSLQHIVKESLSRCSEVVNNSSGETVLLSGGASNIPGLAGRLQKELNDLYSDTSRKPPRVVLVTDEESCNDCTVAAWQGAVKVCMEQDFQTRWIPREVFKEKGVDETLREISEGQGPFPLHSPDTALYKANRAVTSLNELVTLLHSGSQRTSKSRNISPQKPTAAGAGAGAPAKKKDLKINLTQIKTVDNKTGAMSPLSPRSLNELVTQVCSFLEQRKCPERSLIDVKMYLYEQYALNPRKGLGVLETIQTLPDRILSDLTPYINAAPAPTPPPHAATVSTAKLSPGEKSDFFSEDDDEDDEDGVWAMAI